MRRDMSKKLCERPRIHDGWGRGDRYKRRNGKVDVHDLVYHEQMEDEENPCIDVPERHKSNRKRQAMSRGRGDKELGENLQPLFRFIEKQVGRPWDKVYSEICEQVRPDSATQLHILQHLKFHVIGMEGEYNREVLEENGRVYVVNSYVGKSELRKGDIYINLRTNILCKYKKNPLPKRVYPKPEDVVKINDFTYYAKIDGIWNEVIYEQKWSQDLNKSIFRSHFMDNLTGHPSAMLYYHRDKLKYEKRTIPKSILKQMRLKNGKRKN